MLLLSQITDAYIGLPRLTLASCQALRCESRRTKRRPDFRKGSAKMEFKETFDTSSWSDIAGYATLSTTHAMTLDPLARKNTDEKDKRRGRTAGEIISSETDAKKRLRLEERRDKDRQQKFFKD